MQVELLSSEDRQHCRGTQAVLHSKAEFIVYMLDQFPDLYAIGRQTFTRILKEKWAVEKMLAGRAGWRVPRLHDPDSAERIHFAFYRN